MMSVALESSSASISYNALPPGSEAAIAIGENVGKKLERKPSGERRVPGTRVPGTQRGAAGESGAYTLTGGITGRADAMVKGTTYHVTGLAPCSIGTDPKGSAKCSFGVVRAAGGRAEVHLAAPGFDVKMHKDDPRILRFDGKAVTRSNAKDRVTATRQGDNWLVAVNGFNFYTIPDAVIAGG